MADDERCGCGQPLHYRNPSVEAMMRDLVARRGPVVLVEQETSGRAWWIPRHFIALHGVKEAELAAVAARYGFREHTEPSSGGCPRV